MSTSPSLDLPVGLEDLQFDNAFTRELPADPETANERRQVLKACYSRVLPTSVPAPELAAYSREAAALIDLEPSDCETDAFAQIFGGNVQLPGMDPYAMCYGGHQFGNWAGQLGDGRAINLGDVINRADARWTLQLKGAGETPYSRTADGLAVLRSSVREFLCSEAMYHLGVPTTRALSLVTTGQQVMRDMFYDGNAKLEPGAVVCRMAPSFTRFGNFQIFASRRDPETLQRLVDYTLRVDFPHLGTPSLDVMAEWFAEVCRTTAAMIVHWMRVGFVHGVMNTDNMSILGLTIDYGPYGWLEGYDPAWTPNTTDASGRRYCFGNQPAIAQWNLLQLANTIVQLTQEPEPLEGALKEYVVDYQRGFLEMMGKKLGLVELRAEDTGLIEGLFETLQVTETDMTIFFRNLADYRVDVASEEVGVDARLLSCIRDAFYKPEELDGDAGAHVATWIRRYLDRLRDEGTPDSVRREQMNSVNPKYVLRNYLAQLAIDKSEQGDHSLINDLLELMRRPYDEQPDKEEFAAKRPEWARNRAGCSMLSCSS